MLFWYPSEGALVLRLLAGYVGEAIFCYWSPAKRSGHFFPSLSPWKNNTFQNVNDRPEFFRLVVSVAAK